MHGPIMIMKGCRSKQVINGQGSDLHLQVAGGNSSSSELVVHIAPNLTPFTELGDSVQLPDWLSERWKVLTVRVASSESHEHDKGLHSPEFLFHFGQTDCLSFAKVGPLPLTHVCQSNSVPSMSKNQKPVQLTFDMPVQFCKEE